ncbi:MAG: PEGA domain-containing protein [Deltaproteobacteria bacterium]|nr:MAG: PEGA domain-containing protein [Deltaproteobacteria bacterium]
MTTLLAVVAGVAAWVPVSAGAVTQASAVVPLHPEADRTAQHLRALVEQWRRQGGLVEPIDLAALARAEQEAEWKAKTEEAKKAYEEGLEQYDRLSFDDALYRFGRAVELLEQTPMTWNLEPLLEVYAAQAMAYYYAGRVSDAQNRLTDLFTLRPDFQPDPKRLTPEIQSLMEEIRGKVQGAPPATLEVQATPVAAAVYVDGRYQGVTPIEVRKLTPGNHFVLVERPGYLVVQERAVAAPGQIARFTLEPAPKGRELLTRLAALKSGFVSGRISEPAATLARWAGADEALVLGVRRLETGQVHVEAARVAPDGHLLAVASQDFDAEGPSLMNGLSAFLTDLQTKDLPRGPHGEPVTELHSGFSLSFGPKTWGLAAGGVGAAAVIGGVVVGLGAQRRALEAQQIPQIDEEAYQRARQEAMGQALTADLLYLAGAAGIGVGAWLFLQADEGGGGDGLHSVLLPVPLDGGAALMVEGRF